MIRAVPIAGVAEVLQLLPKLQVVVLWAHVAQKGWRDNIARSVVRPDVPVVGDLAFRPAGQVVMEAKTGATANVIWKKDINQLAGSVNWA